LWTNTVELVDEGGCCGGYDKLKITYTWYRCEVGLHAKFWYPKKWGPKEYCENEPIPFPSKEMQRCK
jgi:hypothetical protein